MSFTTRPELTGTFGMVSSTHWLASAVGMSVLERGGNAVDAAVAAGFTLQVVEPHLNGPGGDVPILLAQPDGHVDVYCGQGPTPAAATLDAFSDLGLDLVPGTGLLAAVVPGAFGAWTLMLEQHGTWPLRDVLEPAVGFARDGFPVLTGVETAVRAVDRLFREEWPTSAAIYLASGVPAAGTRFRNTALAETYARVVQEAEAGGGTRERQISRARDVFYRGFVADAVGCWCTGNELMDTSDRRHRGLLTADDLAQWHPAVEPSVHVDYAGLTVHKTGPWGQGPVLLQQLRLLEGFDLAAMGLLSADWIHTVVECAKLAFADREAWYGDPAFADVPLDALLSPSYADQRRALVGDDASYELRPGSPDGRRPVLPRLPGLPAADPAGGVGEPTVRTDGSTRGDTCHLDVVDRDGLMVAATPSGGWLQSSPVIPELGFPLGTRAQMLWLQPGLPNSMAPRKRPRTTLSPTIVMRDGRPSLAFGTPGGDQQDQWSLGFLLAHLHAGLNLQEALDAPMFHSTHFPSSFWPRAVEPGHLVVEGRLDPATIRELRRRGHEVDVTGEWSLGRTCTVGLDTTTGFLKGAANPRGMQGYAAGR